MLLIADSGSTKTDWRLVDINNTIHAFHTSGINPSFQDTEQIKQILKKELFTDIKELLSSDRRMKIYFYGAGCSGPERCKKVENALSQIFINANIQVEHDLLGAARALCRNNEGFAAILGTGSNSCYYNGKKIVQEIGGHGFILGDEGSGAYLGKKLARTFLYDDMPETLKNKFSNKYKITKTTLIDNIHGNPESNKYLASFAPFLSKNSDHKFIRQIVYNSFNDFFNKHILKYNNYKTIPMHSIGSIAYYFSDILKQVAKDKEVLLDKIIKDPIGDLVKYHVNINN